MDAEVFRNIEGMHLSKAFPDDAIRSTLQYKPQPGDLFIVSYPKCGTTWSQHIVYNILMDGQEPEDPLEAILRLPFLELQGAEAAVYAPRPAAFKTHLPFNKVPYSPYAKYIYITRNPYDCCVSYYYHTRNIQAYRFQNGTFDEFFELFLNGKVDYGDYFDSVMSWYEHRTDPNILFLTYEELKRDTTKSVLRMAEFIGDDKGKMLRGNSELLESILQRTSFEYMKDRPTYSRQSFRPSFMASPLMQNLRPELKKGFQNLVELTKKPMTGEFLRKGKIGDWRNHFSQQQIQRMKERIVEATKGSTLMSLWDDVDIP